VHFHQSWYQKNEPDVLIQAGVTSDKLLDQEGSAPFGTQFALATTKTESKKAGK
jgi:hypothetical protein